MPRQYITGKRSARNTSDVPRSGSFTMRRNGMNTIAAPTTSTRKLSGRFLFSARKRASMNMTAIFMNSLGCRLKPPISIQRLAPFTAGAKSTATRSTRPTP